jgi:hypothetical protein
MPRPADQSTKWDYNVKQVKLMTEGGDFSGYYGNQRTDTKQVLGVTTEQYGIVQNKDLMENALQAIDKLGFKGYQQRIVVTNGGARIFAEFTFSNKLLASAVGDKFGYRFVIKNSFDRTLRAAVELAFLRLICTNGCSTLEREFHSNKKHSSGVEVDFIREAIDRAIKRGPSALKVFEELAERAVNDEKGVIILNNLESRGVLSGTVRENITTLWLAPRRAEDKPRNLYSLYNAVTEHLSHKVAGDRFEYARNTDANVLGILSRATKQKDLFATLTTPPKKEKLEVKVEAPVVLAA